MQGEEEVGSNRSRSMFMCLGNVRGAAVVGIRGSWSSYDVVVFYPWRHPARYPIRRVRSAVLPTDWDYTAPRQCVLELYCSRCGMSM